MPLLFLPPARLFYRTRIFFAFCLIIILGTVLNGCGGKTFTYAGTGQNIYGNADGVSSPDAPTEYTPAESERRAANNNVTITDPAAVSGFVIGGHGVEENAEGNTVTINGGSMGGSVLGGFARGGGAVSGNTVVINKGIFKYLVSITGGSWLCL